MSNADAEPYTPSGEQQMKTGGFTKTQLATLYNLRMKNENLVIPWPKFHEKFYPEFGRDKVRTEFYKARDLAIKNKLPGVTFTGLPPKMMPLNFRTLPGDLDAVDDGEDDDSDSSSSDLSDGSSGSETAPQEPPTTMTTSDSSSALRRPHRRLHDTLGSDSPDNEPPAKMPRTGPSPSETAVANATTRTPSTPGQSVVGPLQPLSASSFNSRVRFDRLDRDDWLYIFDLAKNCPEETKRADALAAREKELLFENDELNGVISALQAEIVELKKSPVPWRQTKVDPELSAAMVKMKGLAYEANSSFDELWDKAVKYIPPFHLDSSEFGLRAAHDAIKEKISQIQSSGSGEELVNGSAEMAVSLVQGKESNDVDFGKSAE
ncbi:hypothetical protein FQN50_002971 [Emmonsiellopsis sp. PD_5]|nr:hypothetical protein FQN50_002971 [Emmonsiellopsis sp. PD_5]